MIDFVFLFFFFFFIYSRSDFSEKDGFKAEGYETDAKTNETSDAETSTSGDERISIYGGVKQCCGSPCLLYINELQIKCVLEEDKKMAGKREPVTQVTCIWSQHVLLTTAGGQIHLFGISSRGRGREKRRGKRSELARRLGWRVKGKFHSRFSFPAGWLRLSPRSLRLCRRIEIKNEGSMAATREAVHWSRSVKRWAMESADR